MAIQRLRGSKLVLKIDNVDYAAEISEWKFPKEETKDAGTKTFGDVMKGSVGKATLEVTIVQSTSAEALLMKVFDNPGKDNVPFVLAPHANDTPTVDEPHWIGTLAFPKLRPAIGIKAGDDDSTTEIEFTIRTREKKTQA